jgi:putative transposase
MRLPTFDYSVDGAYFVTICVQGRRCLLGHNIDDRVILTPTGEMATACWQAVPGHFSGDGLGLYVVMPNHFHGIVWISSDTSCGGKASTRSEERPTLGRIVGWFKYESTKRINALRGTPGLQVWQRNYYDHIVRTEEGLYKIAEYIEGNPLSWKRDEMNPDK